MKTTSIIGRNCIGQYEEAVKLTLGVVTATRSILVTQPERKCPLRDHPVCANTHWRSGQEFDHERRCPQHDFSWEPGDWFALCVEGAEVPTSVDEELLPIGTATCEIKLVPGESTWFVRLADGTQIRKIRVLKSQPAPAPASA